MNELWFPLSTWQWNLFCAAFVLVCMCTNYSHYRSTWRPCLVFPRHSFIGDKNNIKTSGNCRSCVFFVCIKWLQVENWPIWVRLWFIDGVHVFRRHKFQTHAHQRNINGPHTRWDHTVSINQQPSEEDKEPREWQIFTREPETENEQFMLGFKLQFFF